MSEDARREDRRTRYTKSVIHEAFFDLLREKGFERMSVADLCRRADINRGTFYLHYVDKYALLDEVIDEALDTEPPYGQDEKTLCQRPPANEDYRLLYSCPETFVHVTKHILERGGAQAIPQIMKETGLDEDLARFVFVFAASGYIAVNNLMGWGRDDRFEEVQALLQNLFDAGINHIAARP